MPNKPGETEASVARKFVEARQRCAPIERYPGEPPSDLAAAYAIQDAAIGMWPDAVAGWKVGLVQPQFRERFGAERITGPVFKKQVLRTGGAFAMISGGFGAVEAEFVIAVAAEPPAAKRTWTIDEAREMAGVMYVGVEFAGSPFARINDFGPAVTVSDFGNNAGLAIGQEIPGWKSRMLNELTAHMRIDGEVAGNGSAADVPGGPLAAFAFILGHCAARGVPLKAGDLISTGAVTGVHLVRPNQSAEADFGPFGKVSCRIVDGAAGAARAASA